MRKFVFSMVLSIIMTLSSVIVIFLLQAPLLTLIYYGFISETNTSIIVANIINSIVNTDSVTILVMISQIVLTVLFVSVLFVFISKIIHVFLKNEKLIKPYYIIFFFITLIVPVFLIFMSILFQVKLSVLTLIVEIVFAVLNTVLILLAKKMLPETTETEYRKILFTGILL